MELTSPERSVLAALTADLRGRFSATAVRLFGSAARGEMDEESDIDLFVIVPVLTWPIEQAIWDRCYEATLACGRKISAVIFADREIDSGLKVSPLVATVRKEGILL